MQIILVIAWMGSRDIGGFLIVFQRTFLGELPLELMEA
jgi:hypothetical protein